MTASYMALALPQTRTVLFLAAPFIGSLLGVLVLRLPRGEPVAVARSHCETCRQVLDARDLVPLLSFAVQGGRCRRCGARIGWFHPGVELAAITVVLWATTVDEGDRLIAGCVLGWLLLALGTCDWRSYKLPDALTLPLILLGLSATWWLHPEQITDHALATACGYLGFRVLAWSYRRWRGYDGLGQGDAKLLAGSGAWLGLVALPNVILLAAIAGLAMAATLRLCGRTMTTRSMLPFGPCLALATWLIWSYG
jgi:leader peptidase (prepilin peptidase)/N-methyltransferase